MSSLLEGRSNINTRYIQYSLRWFVESNPRNPGAPPRYRGRDDTAEDTMVRVPEHQRDYVWKAPKQEALIRSVFHGYPIPSLILTEDYRNRHSVQDGQQRLQTLWRYYNDQFSYGGKFFKDLTEAEKKVFLDYTIPVTDITGATEDEELDIYDLLNQGVALNDGEKLWNRRSKPLVALAIQLLLTRGEGLSALASDAWGAYLDKDTRHSNLANAVAYVAGAAYGSEHITTSYMKLSHMLEHCKVTGGAIKAINEERVKARLTTLLNIYKSADAIQPCRHIGKKKAQWKIGLYSAYILHSIIFAEGDPELLERLTGAWVTFLRMVRTGKTSVENFLKKDGGKANNITLDRLKKGYENLLSMMENGFEVDDAAPAEENEEEAESGSED